MPLDDLTGRRFNRLTVLYRDESKPKGRGKPVYWVCQCDCGNITSVSRTNLINGSVKACGCLKKELHEKRAKETLKDITGQRFGRLVVLHRDEDKPKGHGHKAYWVCQCDCGNIVSVVGTNLRNGKTQSCGCLQKERTSEAALVDLTGQQFGFLIPLYRLDAKKWNKTIWHCKCLNCGGTADVIHSYLTNGDTKSCGCIKRSYGEEKINSILTEHNVNFKTEYTFKDCLSKQGVKLRFDFAIFKDNQLYCLIEFQGGQHTKSVEWFGGEQNLKLTQEHDNIKKEYCKQHYIPLIEIWYEDKDKLNWEYLQEKCNL